jgi:hypothetical protein
MLKEAEPISDVGLRAQRLREAVGILNQYLAANPDSPVREFVQNVKAAYIRKHVQALSVEQDFRGKIARKTNSTLSFSRQLLVRVKRSNQSVREAAENALKKIGKD